MNAVTQPETSRQMRVALVAVLIYIAVYSLEAPFRYVLALTHLIEIILLRDLLILGPLAYIGLTQLLRKRLDPLFVVFGGLLALQGAVFYLNVHALGPIFLGAKLFFNLLLGMLLGARLTNCSGGAFRTLHILFWLTCAGLLIEKFVTPFPWVGMSTNIGGIDVPVSLDWQSGDDLERRVGGFTRISINAACLVPFLGFIVATQAKRHLLRVLVVVLSIGCVWLTTQKGAMVATLAVSLCLCMPGVLRGTALRCAAVAGLAAQIVLPFATNGLLMSEGSGGVFSASSFAARVLYTWPAALNYVYENSVGIFGVGLGGLGGPMRLTTAEGVWMFADNMFIFVVGYLGVFALLFYGAILFSIWRSLRLPLQQTETALALLGFVMWYGTVVTGLEDQITTLALGASLGCLLHMRQPEKVVSRPVLRPRAVPGLVGGES